MGAACLQARRRGAQPVDLQRQLVALRRQLALPRGARALRLVPLPRVGLSVLRATTGAASDSATARLCVTLQRVLAAVPYFQTSFLLDGAAGAHGACTLDCVWSFAGVKCWTCRRPHTSKLLSCSMELQAPTGRVPLTASGVLQVLNAGHADAHTQPADSSLSLNFSMSCQTGACPGAPPQTCLSSLSFSICRLCRSTCASLSLSRACSSATPSSAASP